VDSAFYFLRAAAADRRSEDAALANMMAVLAQRGIRLSPDSLLAWDSHPTLALQNNLLAMANRQGYRLTRLQPPLQVLGSDSSFAAPAYLLNWALQGQPADTLLVVAARQGFEKAQLSAMEEQWGLAHALLRYRLPDHYGAFAAMQDLAERSQFNSNTYYKILGQWGMEQGAPQQAAEWFQQAYMRGDAQAGFYRAMALAEAGRSEEAAQLWLSLPDTALSASLRQSKTQGLLAISTNSLEGLPQAEKLAAARLRLQADRLIPAEINSLLAMLAPQEQAQALLQLARQALRAGEAAEAQPYLSRLRSLQLSPQQQQEAAALQLQHQLLSGGRAPQEPLAGDTLLQLKQGAMQQLAAGDSAAALQQLGYIARITPFETDALLLATRLYNARNQREEAYELLRNALMLNRYSLPLLEAYALQSARMGLENYAQDALLELEISSPPQRHSRFLSQYEKILESRAATEAW
jgi:hypothetical protein